jgi:adenylate kinase family enzyme
MKKILIIGSGGAGKSTFARRLSVIVSVDVIHLDAFYWNPGWVETPQAEWRKIVEVLIARDSWIMDGNFSSTLDIRLKACDAVIFLDLSTRICLWRVITRMFKYRYRGRPDMAKGCRERFDLEFILWVWNYKRETRPKIVKLIETYAANKRVVWLQSKAEVESFLSSASVVRDRPDAS